MTQPTVARERRRVVAMKAESTYGTDVLAGSYVAGDVVPCMNIAPSLNVEVIENLALSGDLGRRPSIIGAERGGVSFAMPFRGAGAAYSASVKTEAHNPMLGCAMSATGSFGVGLEKWTFAPSNTHTSFTIYIVQENGVAIKLVGCFGSMSWGFRAGAVLELRFTFTGLIAGVADVTYVAGSLGTTPQYPVAKSAAFQIDTANYAPRIASVGFDLNNALSPIPSINASGGLVGYFVADRNPVLTIDPEADIVANYGWYTKFLAGNLADCTFQVGTTQYNRIKFEFLKAQIVEHGMGARDGLTSFPTRLLATLNAGNDDYSIVVD